jgi:hypothetical protein
MSKKPKSTKPEKELLKFLEQFEVMFDGVPFTEDDKKSLKSS